MTINVVGDNFSRGDNPTNFGSAVTAPAGSLAWIQNAGIGAFGIQSNTGYLSVSDATANGFLGPLAWSDHTFADCSLSLDIFSTDAAGFTGIVFRATDTGNMWLFQVTTGPDTWYLFKVVGGSETEIDSGSLGSTPGTIAVDLRGSSIRLRAGNTILGTYTDSFNDTATLHGISMLGAGSAVDDWQAGEIFASPPTATITTAHATSPSTITVVGSASGYPAGTVFVVPLRADDNNYWAISGGIDLTGSLDLSTAGVVAGPQSSIAALGLPGAPMVLGDSHWTPLNDWALEAGSVSGSDHGAGAATHFTVTGPATPSAGYPITITVTAKDSGGLTDTSYGGTVHFTSSDGGATLPSPATLTSGVGTFSVTFATLGPQDVVASDGVISGTLDVTVQLSGSATHFSVSAPATAQAGIPVSVVVTALAADNSTAASYAGTVHLTSSDGAASLAADHTLTAGSHTFSVTFNTLGEQTIVASDLFVPSVTGEAFVGVGPGPAVQLLLSVPTHVESGAGFEAAVEALDSHGRRATSYVGTIHITSSDGSAVLPPDAACVAGEGLFFVDLVTAGSKTVVATDIADGSLTDTKSVVVVVDTGGGAVPAEALLRWTFTDTETAETYTFGINPNTGGSPQYLKHYENKATCGPPGPILVFEGRAEVSASQFSGVVQTKADYLAMRYWYTKRVPITVVDDLGRTLLIVFTQWHPKRAPHRNAPWRHTYDVTYLELSGALL